MSVHRTIGPLVSYSTSIWSKQTKLHKKTSERSAFICGKGVDEQTVLHVSAVQEML